MDSHVFWTHVHQPGLEQLHVVEHETGVVADGLVLGIAGATPFRMRYHVRADSAWTVQECHLQMIGEQGQTVSLSSDGMGHWIDAADTAYSALDGCLAVDISMTPFTNTLALRRLALSPGEAADILVAYITVPDLSVRPARQRYTCLSRSPSGGLYRYDGLDSGLSADLAVDAQGLVVEYLGIWRRAEMRSHGDDTLSPPRAVLDGLLAAGPQPELANNLQLFGRFVGDWAFDWASYQPSGAVSQTGSGEIHFAWVLDGRAIQDVWIFRTREDQHGGLSLGEWGSTLRSYDPALNVWTISWHGPVNHTVRTMTARAVEDEIWVEGPNLSGQPLRWILSQITGHSFRWSNYVSEDGGQTWRLQEDLEARRLS